MCVAEETSPEPKSVQIKAQNVIYTHTHTQRILIKMSSERRWNEKENDDGTDGKEKGSQQQQGKNERSTEIKSWTYCMCMYSAKTLQNNWTNTFALAVGIDVDEITGKAPAPPVVCHSKSDRTFWWKSHVFGTRYIWHYRYSTYPPLNH